MAANLATREQILRDALEIRGLKTKKASVNQALGEFIDRRRQVEIPDLSGKLYPQRLLS